MARVTTIGVHWSGIWLVSCLALAIAPRVSATIIESCEFTCPTCGTTFVGSLVVTTTTYGKRLDMKPLGSDGAPPPLPECPKDHFAFYDCAFADAPPSRSPSEDDTDKPQFLREDCSFSDSVIARLRVHVRTDGYRALVAEDNVYLLLGSIQEILGMSAREIAYTYLQASWLAEGQQAAWERCLVSTLAWLDEAPTAELDSSEVVSERMLRVELLRLLGRFDEAGQGVDALLGDSGPQSPIQRRILSYERKLIRAKDRRPHPIPMVDR